MFNDPFFTDWENENELVHHPLLTFPSIYPYHYYNHRPLPSSEKHISKASDVDIFRSIDFCPNINLSEDEKNYYIHADLPGMSKDQVKMELSDDDRVLTISGERETVIDYSKDNEDKEKKKEKEKEKEKDIQANENKEANSESKKEEEKTETPKKYSRIECSYGKFERSFSIPENADINSIEAKMENGVLEVTFHKMESPKKDQRRSIQIQ